MNRIKIAAISTTAAAMILGSSIVFASAPAADTDGTSADQTQQTTELIKPVRRGGSAGHNLKK